MNRPGGGHVSHICWYSDGGTNGPASSAAGLWGVWEMTTSRPHFELQRGGVFRIVPV